MKTYFVAFRASTASSGAVCVCAAAPLDVPFAAPAGPAAPAAPTSVGATYGPRPRPLGPPSTAKEAPQPQATTARSRRPWPEPQPTRAPRPSLSPVPAGAAGSPADRGVVAQPQARASLPPPPVLLWRAGRRAGPEGGGRALARGRRRRRRRQTAAVDAVDAVGVRDNARPVGKGWRRTDGRVVAESRRRGRPARSRTTGVADVAAIPARCRVVRPV